MKRYKDFSNSALDSEVEKAYLNELFNNYYTNEHKKKYAAILEEKYRVLRTERDDKPTKTLNIMRWGKYAIGAAACFLVFFLLWPEIDGSRNNFAELVDKYSTTDFLQNREIKRGSTMDDEYRTAAIQYYNEGKYQDALQSYESVKNLDNEDKFWMAMATFYEKDYVSAESIFEELYIAGDLKYANELKWYYALSLLQNGKKKEAEVLLREMNSWKSNEARQLLNALK